VHPLLLLEVFSVNEISVRLDFWPRRYMPAFPKSILGQFKKSDF
jgi:hypothetical protein